MTSDWKVQLLSEALFRLTFVVEDLVEKITEGEATPFPPHSYRTAFAEIRLNLLAVEYGWEEAEERIFYETLNEFYKRLQNKDFDFSYSDIEDALHHRLGLDYQALKPLFINLAKSGRFTELIWHYLCTKHQKTGSVASEYTKLFKELQNEICRHEELKQVYKNCCDESES